MANASDCPATYYVDSGDWAEPLSCDLPIEHNIDGAWHESGWTTDDEALTVRWAPEIGETERWPRPPYSGPSPELIKRLVDMVIEPQRIFDRVPVATGTTVAFRKWGTLDPNPNYRYSDEPLVVSEPNSV